MHRSLSLISASLAPFIGGLVVLALQSCGAALTATTDDDAGAAGSQGSGGSAESTTGGTGGGAAGTGSMDGSTGTGGSAGTATGGGGSGGTVAHPDAAVDCTAGTISFHLTEAAGTDYCVGVQCGTLWVTVKTMAGKVLTLSGGCLSSCDRCTPTRTCVGAGACIAPQHMKPEGETLTWDGIYYMESMCTYLQPGGTQFAGTSCQNKQCAAPGKYVATMCANRSPSDAGVNGFCMADQTPTCIDVPFDFPSASTVEGVIGSTK